MKRLLTGFVLTALLAGCSSVTVRQDYDTSANFSKLKTFTWQSEQQKPSPNELANNSLIDARIRTAADNALAGSGYRKTADAQADFLVNYYYTIEEKLESRDRVSTGFGFGTGSRGSFSTISIGVGSGRRDFEQGTLIIDIIDPKTDKLLWRGFARQRLVWQSDPQKTTAKINSTVSAILAKFPPKK
jgi:hypothetical protein